MTKLLDVFVCKGDLYAVDNTQVLFTGQHVVELIVQGGVLSAEDASKCFLLFSACNSGTAQKLQTQLEVATSWVDPKTSYRNPLSDPKELLWCCFGVMGLNGFNKFSVASVIFLSIFEEEEA